AGAVGPGKVADALPALSDRDHIHDIADAVIMEVEARLAPFPEIVSKFGLGLPAMRRDQIRIARILAILAELGLGKEIVEADLSDAAAELQTDVPIPG